MPDRASSLLGTLIAFLCFAFASGLLFVIAWPLLLLAPVGWYFITRKHQQPPD